MLLRIILVASLVQGTWAPAQVPCTDHTCSNDTLGIYGDENFIFDPVLDSDIAFYEAYRDVISSTGAVSWKLCQYIPVTKAGQPIPVGPCALKSRPYKIKVRAVDTGLLRGGFSNEVRFVPKGVAP